MQALRTFSGAALFLAASATIAVAQEEPEIGLFRFSGGREVYVEYLPDISGLAMMEYPSGRIRPLRREQQGHLSFGPSIGLAEPVTARLTMRGPRLRWSEGGRTMTGSRVAFRTEDVLLINGDVTLAGSLTLPASRGPCPAVVLLHGGGAQTRDFFWTTRFFASRGFAVLAYDKRGVGASTGDWRTASVHDLAGDALTAVEYLRARPDIRSNRIGLYGASAGGWTAPLAATMARERIAFIVARSPSALPERRNVIYEVEGDLRNAGFGEEAVSHMRALHELDVAVAKGGGAGWNELRATLRDASQEPWFELARLPADLIENTPGNLNRIAAHIAREQRNWIDPPALWRQLDIPILIQLGALDRYVPGPDSAATLREALAQNPHAEVRLYPSGDHAMFASASGYARDIPAVTHYADGYLSDLDRFLRRMAR